MGKSRTLGCLLALASAVPLSAGTIKVPAGSNLVVSQREDPSTIEHLPLQNLITWEIFILHGVCSGGTCRGGTQNGQACAMDTDCPAPPLTITGGTAQFYDAAGNPIDDPVLGPLAITPATIEQVVTEYPTDPPGPLGPQVVLGPDGAILPEHANVALPFPFEKVSHNFVPASVEMSLCFKEFEGPGGTCPDPLEVKGVTLAEYRVPAGQTYIYPLQNPSIYPSGILFTGAGGGHEIGDNHRLARNQRYAYDVGVLVNGVDCTDGCDANPDYFIYTEPVYAVADGVVVVAEKDHPENPAPGPVFAPGAGQCPSQRCDGLSQDTCDGNEFPGSGNQIVLVHGNGEFTTMAHMTTGSNSLWSCDDSILQGWQLGNVGNVGTSGAPHLHYSSLNTPSPEDGGARSFPMYFNNIQFPTAGYGPKRQLDVAMLSGTQWTVLAPPAPLPANPTLPGGSEAEPNDGLAAHNTVALPASVAGTAEVADVGEMAVRGDGIEDVYRLDLAAPDAVRFELTTASATQNLDLYVTTPDLRVLNETHQGTARSGPERVCLELPAGPVYAFVSNVDGPGKTADAPYTFTAASDPQTIACAVTNAVQPVPVDGACQATVEFTLALHDNCCLDPATLEVKAAAANPTANATLGPVELDPPVVLGPRDVTVSGRVAVSGLTSCPAVVQVQASAKDCSGNSVSTITQGTGCSTGVVDLTPPSLLSTLAAAALWPPNHDLEDVGLTNQVSDNCDGNVAGSLEQKAWSDEAEIGGGSGSHAPDAVFGPGLRLRAEREGGGDGRVYLVTGKVVDACGNPGFSCVTAGVPHGGGAAAAASLAAQAAAADALCEANLATPPPGFTAIGVSAPVGPKQ